MDEVELQAKLYSWNTSLPILRAAQLLDGGPFQVCGTQDLHKFRVRPVLVKTIWLHSSAQCTWFQLGCIYQNFCVQYSVFIAWR